MNRHQSLQARGGQQARRAYQRFEQFKRHDPLWRGQVTVLVAVALGLALPDILTIGPTWLLPALEGALFVALLVASPGPPIDLQDERRRRALRIAFVGLVSATNAVSLFLLAHELVDGSHRNGRELLFGGVVLWLTAVLLFAVWYWELDRGGPVRRARRDDRQPDFMFPQMSDAPSGSDWRPRLPDYLYLALINGATFAPAESMAPLSDSAKLVMSVHTLASLTTIAVVVSGAVNLLSGSG